jgi:hypothetical protein
MENKNSIAKLTFILGMISLLFGILTGVPAIIYGHKFLKYYKASNKVALKRYFILNMTGLCLGYISFIISFLFLILYLYSEIKI